MDSQIFSKKIIREGIALLFILFFGLGLHYKSILEYPNNKHAWAQMDHYALALGFVENDLDFFHPQTFHYNHQFPDWWKTPQKTTITSVDFPIHDYIPAVIMKVTGIKSPVVYRLYILFYSFLGLFFLFRIAYLITHNTLKSYIVLILAASVPTFAFYQSALLPTIPSISNVFIGLWFYMIYRKTDQTKHFGWSIFFFTIAALARTTFLIPLIAICGVEFFYSIFNRQQLLKKLLIVVSGFLMIIGYFLYNTHLRHTYGSIFLGELMPAKDLQQAKEILHYIFGTYTYQFLSPIHYIVLIAGLGVVLFRFIFKKNKVKMTHFSLFVLFFALGCIAFFVAMMYQFKYHDYYYLDTFYLLFVFLLIGCVHYFYLKVKWGTVVFFGVIGIVAFFNFFTVYSVTNSMYKTHKNSELSRSIANYEKNASWLESLNLHKDDKVLILNPFFPNEAFVFLRQKGFVGMNLSSENIEDYLSFNFDYFLFQKDFFYSRVYPYYPDILQHVVKVKENKDFIIAKRGVEKEQTLLRFLSIENQTPSEICKLDFKETEPCFIHFETEEKGNNIYGFLPKNKEFGLEFNGNTPGNQWLIFEGDFMLDSLLQTEFVITLTNNNNENVFYVSKDISVKVETVGKFYHIQYFIKIPPVNTKENSFKTYLWNINKQKVTFKNIALKLI